MERTSNRKIRDTNCYSDLGFIYVIQSGKNCKIGVTRHLETRYRAIRTGNPDAKLIFATDPIDHYVDIETIVHAKMRNYNVSGEWFKATPMECIQVIKETVEHYKMGIW